MNLLNSLFGGPSENEILAMLGLSRSDVERYRDCWIDDDEGVIVICTRTGGLNRETWKNEKLTSHPLYIQDYDDDTDATYAYYKFEMPGGAEDGNA